MNTLTFKTEIVTREPKTIELTVPCFFRNKTETYYVAMLDEATVVEVVKDDYETAIRNYNNKKWGAGLDRIRDAFFSETHTACVETEFLEAFDKAVASISLNPILTA